MPLAPGADEPLVARPTVDDRPRAGSRAIPAPPARVALAVLVIALMPFPAILRGWGDPKLPYDYLTIVFPVDVAFAGLLVVGLGPVLRRLRARGLGVGAALWLALTAVLSIALLVHPSSRGVQRVFELWGVAVLAATFTEALDGEAIDIVLGAFVGVAVLETSWSAAQLIIGTALGLHSLGEDAHPLWPFGRGVVAPMGSMVHPYVLAGLALVAGVAAAWRALSARRPGPWLVAAAVAIAPVGFTFSRAGLLSLALVAGGFGVAALTAGARRSVCLLAVLAVCAGFAVPAAIWSKGWRSRATDTTAASSAGQLTTERTHLVHEAATLIRAEPVAGVGPGQYIPALQHHLRVEADKSLLNFRPVHNVVLLVGAEGGVVALLVIAALFAIVGWRAVRAGPLPIAVYLAYFPFAMLDHFAYSFPQGLVLTGCWLGLLDAMSRRPLRTWRSHR